MDIYSNCKSESDLDATGSADRILGVPEHDQLSVLRISRALDLSNLAGHNYMNQLFCQRVGPKFS